MDKVFKKSFRMEGMNKKWEWEDRAIEGLSEVERSVLVK
jgi:hypothetical protein